MCNVFSGSSGGPGPFRAEKRLGHRHTGVASALPGRPDPGRAPRAALHRAGRRGVRETCRAGCPRARSRGAAPGTSRARSSLRRWRGTAPGTCPAGCPRARRCAAPGTYPAGSPQGRGSRSSGGRRYLCRRPPFRRGGDRLRRCLRARACRIDEADLAASSRASAAYRFAPEAVRLRRRRAEAGRTAPRAAAW